MFLLEIRPGARGQGEPPCLDPKMENVRLKNVVRMEFSMFSMEFVFLHGI
jgi:hypothetical protein